MACHLRVTSALRMTVQVWLPTGTSPTETSASRSRWHQSSMLSRRCRLPCRRETPTSPSRHFGTKARSSMSRPSPLPTPPTRPSRRSRVSSWSRPPRAPTACRVAGMPGSPSLKTALTSSRPPSRRKSTARRASSCAARTLAPWTASRSALTAPTCPICRSCSSTRPMPTPSTRGASCSRAANSGRSTSPTSCGPSAARAPRRRGGTRRTRRSSGPLAAPCSSGRRSGRSGRRPRRKGRPWSLRYSNSKLRTPSSSRTSTGRSTPTHTTFGPAEAVVQPR
mmetsp:Transcript_118135/g.294611  ORF Transcript_118135/g.294611 Transcript_118135/m.294611 type:complete len:280 (+) Transcript_118135:2068-2907(+)